MRSNRPSHRQSPSTGRFSWPGALSSFLLAATTMACLSTGPNATAQILGPVPGSPSSATRHIYSETANPTADIAAALVQAKREHKRVLLDFGGDWCGDCQVLDIYLHQAPNADLLQKNFVLVHIWIGHMDANLAVPEKYGVPIHKGVPALAVLDAGGKVLYAQKAGEFEAMSHMQPTSVTEFLEKWKS